MEHITKTGLLELFLQDLSQQLLGFLLNEIYHFSLSILFTGCANTVSTRLVFKSDDSTLIVEIPKEIN